MSAAESLQEEIEEQRATGGDLLAGTETDCPVCGDGAVAVRERNTPLAGALPLDGYYAHIDDGDAYYHHDD